MFWIALELKNLKMGLIIKLSLKTLQLYSQNDSSERGRCHKRQKPQAPTPQAPVRNRQTRKVANAKGLNRNTNLT